MDLMATAIKRSNVALLLCDTLRLRGVGRSVDVEERVDGRCRPVRDRNAVARSPALDLAQVFLKQRLAQILPQRHRPQADHGVAPFTGARARERTPGLTPSHSASSN